MPKKLRETVTYEVVVEAEDGYAAQELAAELWAQSENPTEDFGGQGEGVVPVWYDPIEESEHD